LGKKRKKRKRATGKKRLIGAGFSIRGFFTQATRTRVSPKGGGGREIGRNEEKTNGDRILKM